MITITPTATDKIIDVMSENHDKNLYIRLLVEGGGCSGFQYKFMVDEKHDDDFEIGDNNVKLLVDSISMQYLENATVDYKDELWNSGFTVINPNVKSTCGCGASFYV